MSAWRREAIRFLPELRPLIERAWSPMSLWISLQSEFDDAVAQGEDGLIRRLLEYAAWCLSDRSGHLPNDTSTAVVCAFYEHLPTCRAYWPKLREWIAPDVFHVLRPHLGYHLTEQELAELVSIYGGTRRA